MPQDHPLIRKGTLCPLCLGHKNEGLIACWPCYRRHVGYGGQAERVFDRAERALGAGAGGVVQLQGITGEWSMCPCGSRQAPGHQCWP